ncbi:MAG TPA: BON domain-containing protein [Polyangia bacterium]|nr:BON domain-containing protein [Polyangia bacterium]
MKSTLLGALAIAITTNVGVALANDNDDRLEDRIEARFNHDAKLKGHEVRVDVEDGVATLKGKVPDQAHKVRAERLAKVAGVTRIDNKIDIDTDTAKDKIEDNARMEKKRIEDRAEKAKDRVDERADRTKDRLDANAKAAKERAEHPATDRNDKVVVERPNAPPRKETVSDEVTDSWITTKVKAQFVGVDALKGSDISVDTNQHGVVTLTGTVPNEAARAKAIEIVKTTKGVHRVIDDMKWRP